MHDKPVALVTGANQGIGLQIAKDLVVRGFTVLVGSTGIKVNACSPGFIKTNLNNYGGTWTVEEGAREPVRLALLGPDGPTGTFTRWENETIPW